ncbi:MAG: hypothetical protein QOJ50_2562, partial [Cryptosporangiaceae bacterium]|nr:hypothetical protein [Cryptosporangiaceae bacterium]
MRSGATMSGVHWRGLIHEYRDRLP